MKRQVIQNFLNLPGITGVALMDGRSRPFFSGIETTLDSQQCNALAQGIQQVIDTTPPDFDTFCFCFSGRQALVHKLKRGVTLLVLASEQLSVEDYGAVLPQLKTTLEEDLSNAVATFRLIAGTITHNNSSAGSEIASLSQIATSPEHQIVCGEVMAALNQLSDFTSQYLGKMMVVNTWKSSRIQADWLEQFQLDRSAHFLLKDSSLTANSGLTAEQHEWIKQWVRSFISRGSKIIRDFPNLVTDQALNEKQRSLLLDPKN
ncbi:hypothetical protein C7271_02500 [filamentous cyanobacterium CCP5]|nr:hypothetical protein C7271_02500 [filamentous cyanobacterium CCP5]